MLCKKNMKNMSWNYTKCPILRILWGEASALICPYYEYAISHLSSKWPTWPKTSNQDETFNHSKIIVWNWRINKLKNVDCWFQCRCRCWCWCWPPCFHSGQSVVGLTTILPWFDFGNHRCSHTSPMCPADTLLREIKTLENIILWWQRKGNVSTNKGFVLNFVVNW